MVSENLVHSGDTRCAWVSALVLVFIQLTTLSSCPDRGGKEPIQMWSSGMEAKALRWEAWCMLLCDVAISNKP